MSHDPSAPLPDPSGQPDRQPDSAAPPGDSLTPDQRAFARLLGRLLSELWEEECKARAQHPLAPAE
jgi:hypothetical protein